MGLPVGIGALEKGGPNSRLAVNSFVLPSPVPSGGCGLWPVAYSQRQPCALSHFWKPEHVEVRMEPMRPIDEDAYIGSSVTRSWRWWLSFLAVWLLGFVLAAVFSGWRWGLAVVVVLVSSGALEWWRRRARTRSVD